MQEIGSGIYDPAQFSVHAGRNQNASEPDQACLLGFNTGLRNGCPRWPSVVDWSSKLHSYYNGIIHSWCGETNYTVPVCAKTLRAISTKNQIRVSELRSSPLTKTRFCDSNSSEVTDNQNRLHVQNTSLWKIKSVIKVRSAPHGTFCCCYAVCRIVVIKMPRGDIDNTRPTQSA